MPQRPSRSPFPPPRPPAAPVSPALPPPRPPAGPRPPAAPPLPPRGLHPCSGTSPVKQLRLMGAFRRFDSCSQSSFLFLGREGETEVALSEIYYLTQTLSTQLQEQFVPRRWNSPFKEEIRFSGISFCCHREAMILPLRAPARGLEITELLPKRNRNLHPKWPFFI